MKRSACTPIFVALLALAAMFATLTGCGSSGSSIGAGAASGTSKKATGQVTFTVTWPTQPVKVGGKVIPVAAQSITFSITGGADTPSQKTYTQTIPAPVSSYTFSGLELGTYTATATAFPTQSGSGNAQAIGTSTAPVLVKAGATSMIPVHMFATVKSITITPATVYLAVGSTLQLIATAYDSTNTMVVTTGAITWNSLAPTIASVSSSGLVGSLKVGTATITAQYIDGTTPVNADGTGAIGSITINTVSVGLSTAASWAKFHGDAQNTGQAGVLVKGNASLGKAVASFTASNVVDLSSPAVDSDGTVYVGSWDKNFYALKRNGSSTVLNGPGSWSYPTGGMIESSPAISASGIVYVGSYDGNVYAFSTTPANPSNITPIWTFTPPGGGVIHGSPAIGPDGTVYIGASTGTDQVTGITRTGNALYAVDGLTGAQKWAFSPGTVGGVQTAPALSSDGSVVYFGDLDGRVYAVVAASGASFFSPYSIPSGEFFSSSPAIANVNGRPTLFLGALNTNGNPDMFAIDAVTGAGIWPLNPNGGASTGAGVFIPGGVYSSPAVSTDAQGNALAVYVGSYDTGLAQDNAMFQLTPSSGAINWQYPAAGTTTPIGPVASSPVIGKNGAVYFGSDDGNVYSVLSTGSSQWSAPVQVGNPVQDLLYLVESTPGLGPDGTVYIGCWNGRVIAIQ